MESRLDTIIIDFYHLPQMVPFLIAGHWQMEALSNLIRIQLLMHANVTSSWNYKYFHYKVKGKGITSERLINYPARMRKG